MDFIPGLQRGPLTAELAPYSGGAARPGRFDNLDALCVAGLIVLGFALLIWRADSVPLQSWDEARNANNALELALRGTWLVPTYGGVPDHWNTKPPLLTWVMSALLRLGVAPLAAVRLPSAAAALGCAGVVWGFVRFVLRDRIGAMIGALCLLSTVLFVGWHIGRTGDFDAPLALFELLYVLGFWLAIGRGPELSVGWLGASALALVAAVMTKGVAGGFAAPGLAAFVLVSGRARHVLLDWRVWLVAGAAGAACAGYYLTRELYDPGYLRGVWDFELGGRFLIANDDHGGPWTAYLLLLLVNFEPGFLFTSSAAATLWLGGQERRSVVTICLLCAASVLLVLMTARTKLPWYVAPMLPLMALAGGVGMSDLLRRMRRGWVVLVCQGGVMLLLAEGYGLTLYRNQVVDIANNDSAAASQLWYGALIAAAADRPMRLVVVDGGVANNGGLINYDPVLKFHVALARQDGVTVDVVMPGESLAPGTLAGSCDQVVVRRWLEDRRLTDVQRVHGCMLGRVAASAG